MTVVVDVRLLMHVLIVVQLVNTAAVAITSPNAAITANIISVLYSLLY
jgi:hypothetical protein